MKTLKGIEKLAVDANPTLSAIIGGNARAVFLKADNVSFYTTIFNFREVEKYIPILASKRNIPLDDIYMALSSLPISVCDIEFYKDKVNKAKGMVEERDPDDVHLLSDHDHLQVRDGVRGDVLRRARTARLGLGRRTVCSGRLPPAARERGRAGQV